MKVTSSLPNNDVIQACLTQPLSLPFSLYFLCSFISLFPLFLSLPLDAYSRREGKNSIGESNGRGRRNLVCSFLSPIDTLSHSLSLSHCLWAVHTHFSSLTSLSFPPTFHTLSHSSVFSLYFLYSSFFIFPVANLPLHRSLVTLCFSLTPYFFLLLSLSDSSSFSLFLYFFLSHFILGFFPLFLTDRLPHFFLLLPSCSLGIPTILPLSSTHFPFCHFLVPTFFPPLPPMILGNKCDTSRARIEL